MLNRTVLIFSVLITLAVTIFLLTIYNTLPDNNVDLDVASEEFAPQTEQEKAFILANKKLIHATAYVMNLEQRFNVCRNLHQELSNDSADIDNKLTEWANKLDSQYKGELAQHILHKLESKMIFKTDEDFAPNSPSLKYCQDLRQRIAIDDLAPEVRHAIARGK